MSGPPDPSVEQMLAEARLQFAASLPAKTAAIEEQLARGAWDEARRAAHKLRGSAGTYGFVALGTAAGEVEEALLATALAPDASAAARIREKAGEARAEAERIAKEGK
jgi:HPt (histidine-containing phosphotransfer) domain-containing protein